MYNQIATNNSVQIMLDDSLLFRMTKTKYLEMRQAQQLLHVLEETDGLELPVCIEHRDKTDFILSTRSRRIGLEISTFRDEEVRHAEHLADTRFANAFIPNAFTTNKAFQNARGPLSTEEIVDTMFNWEAPGEDVIESARHIARKIFAAIRLKRQKFRSPTFDKFDGNWLLLSDYPNPFSDWITEDILARHFQAACERTHLIGSEFDRIFIFCGPRCFRLRQDKLAEEPTGTKA
jgi:hypothetical protein